MQICVNKGHSFIRVHKSCNNAAQKNVQDPIDREKDDFTTVIKPFCSKEDPPETGRVAKRLKKQNGDMVSNHRFIERELVRSVFIESID
jgi:hypothetical protein